MNHKVIYDNIVKNAKLKTRKKLKKQNPEYVYYENHHILPKCLGGTNEKENLVLLTPREHFVCHKLLTYIYVSNKKIALAFHKMAFGLQKLKYKISSRDYEYARIIVSNSPTSIETRRKLSEARKGRISPMKGKHHSKETKEKLSISITGIKRSDETKEKLRNINAGENNPMYGNPGHWAGTHLSEEKKQNLRNLYKGKTLEEIYGDEKAKKIKEKLSKISSGKKQSVETIEKRKKKLTGKSRTEEQKKKTKETTKLAMQNPLIQEKIRLGVEKRKENIRIKKGGNLDSHIL